ncbi:KDP operon transcriptional regulatory protein KdpE [subsurface metagenome]
MVKEKSPDITIINMELPSNDIYETIKEIRSVSTEPIIVISGKHNENTLVKAIDYGADAFLTKPFSQITLMAMANNLMRRKGSL